jgi:hypothetical protein
MTRARDKQAGFALAAMLADDRKFEQVRPFVDASFVSSDAAPSAPVDRRSRIAALLRDLRPALTERSAGLPARLAVLIAPQLPRSVAACVLRDAPAQRSGFMPAPTLVRCLARIARHAEEHTRR